MTATTHIHRLAVVLMWLLSTGCLDVEFETTEYVLGPSLQVDLRPPNEPGLDVVRLGSGRAGRHQLEVYCTDLTVMVFQDGVETNRQTGSFLRFALELSETSSYDVTLDRTNGRDCRVVLYPGTAIDHAAPDGSLGGQQADAGSGAMADASGSGEQ